MAGGFRSPLFIMFGFSGGTVTPPQPLSTTAVSSRSLVSQLNIRGELLRISGARGTAAWFQPINVDAVKAFSAIQDYANSIDDRLRRLSTSLNSVGLSKDPAGNVVVQGSTFTVSLPLQTLVLSNKTIVITAPPAPPAQGPPLSSMTWWLNEATNELMVRVTRSDGVVVEGVWATLI